MSVPGSSNIGAFLTACSEKINKNDATFRTFGNPQAPEDVSKKLSGTGSTPPSADSQNCDAGSGGGTNFTA